jgi:hypothetical protein
VARAFTSADVLQHNDGSNPAQIADPGVSLPSGTTEGNGGVIVIAALATLDPPEQWSTAARASTSDSAAPILAIMSRPDIPANETGWTFAGAGGSSTFWTWLAEEWTNLCSTPVWATAHTNQALSPASTSTGTTGSPDPAFYVAIAAVYLIGAATATTGWPSSVSWSNGFTETDVLTIGTGQTSTSFQLRVARKYETDPSSGPWETTATYNATQANKSSYACLAVFRAESYPGEA